MEQELPQTEHQPIRLGDKHILRIGLYSLYSGGAFWILHADIKTSVFAAFIFLVGLMSIGSISKFKRPVVLKKGNQIKVPLDRNQRLKKLSVLILIFISLQLLISAKHFLSLFLTVLLLRWPDYFYRGDKRGGRLDTYLFTFYMVLLLFFIFSSSNSPEDLLRSLLIINYLVLGRLIFPWHSKWIDEYSQPSLS